jgi:hypothetical protein
MPFTNIVAFSATIKILPPPRLLKMQVVVEGAHPLEEQGWAPQSHLDTLQGEAGLMAAVPALFAPQLSRISLILRG